MPKVVDHDQRRRQVAQAMWTAVRKYGFEGASIRQVAAEAGISVGLVQHYFSTKEQLEHFAMERMISSAQQRMTERIEALGPPATTRALLRQVLGDLTVAADEQRLAEYQALLAFSLRSLQQPEIAAELQTSDAELRRFVAESIQGAKERGEVRPEADPEAETTLLLCFADGCGQRVLLGHLAPDDAAAALDRVLDRIFTAPGDGTGTAPATPSPE